MTTIAPRLARYTDSFLNALMYPHQMTARGEVYFNGAKVADLDFINGSVTGDRGSRTRRSFTGSFDPRKAPRTIADLITPYGAELRVLRGIRYPDNTVEEYPIFYGRVEFVDFSRTECSVRAASRCANITDARFEAPRQATTGMTVVNQMKALISEVMPAAVIDVATSAALTITTAATWDRERDEALDNLASSIGAEWYAGPDGHFHIDPLPANNGEPADWIVDAGDIGVLITRRNSLDRAEIYNAMVVNGEPPDGTVPVYGVARDTNPASMLRWGGPFGKVPRFFSSQFITTQAQADSVALDMLADNIAGTRGVEVSCIANPKLIGTDTILIDGGAEGFDGMYFINSFTMPLGPDEPMSLSCNTAMEFTVTRDESILQYRTPRVRGAYPMAVSRINVPDMIDRRAHKLARSRTALVRMGQVTALNANGTVQVRIGGGVFTAYTFVAFAVNDVVAVITDTDAWWVLGKVRKL